ncbi:hypothetical protein OAC97_04010 [Flavobacteriaceae bacterium]|jgi:hypothetical protein|nr:hypothetical protein [Flavobacteriaceae bacterium]
MEFNIRPLGETDYEDILVGWWKDWKWTPPLKDFLPSDGKGGVMVLDNDIPVCAGFVYMTNSKVAWVDWIISNKEYKKKPQRQQALSLLIKTLTDTCKNSGNKFCYALLKNKSLTKTYEDLGYIAADSYSQEMIKKL